MLLATRERAGTSAKFIGVAGHCDGNYCDAVAQPKHSKLLLREVVGPGLIPIVRLDRYKEASNRSCGSE